MQNLPLASVRSGLLLGDGAHAAITFDLGDGPVSLALPAPEVTALLTVCAALAAQAAALSPDGEVPVLQVQDWKIGRTSSQAVVLRLQSDNGASLLYRLTRQQALELRDAMTMATAAPSEPPRTQERQRQPDNAQLAELVALRTRVRDNPAALEMVESCVALVRELDAANDEGRAAYFRKMSELVSATRQHLHCLESLAARTGETPAPVS